MQREGEKLMERETVMLIRRIIQEASSRQQMEASIQTLAEDAYARYCEDEDFDKYVKTVLDLLLEVSSQR